VIRHAQPRSGEPLPKALLDGVTHVRDRHRIEVTTKRPRRRALAQRALVVLDQNRAVLQQSSVQAGLSATHQLSTVQNDLAFGGGVEAGARVGAKGKATTRSAAAVDLWLPRLDGAVVAIGNAPTALFRLLELLAQPGMPRPAAILAFPVGFVGAAESKDALIAAGTGIPYITLTGREGGSALAAAAVNAVVRGDTP